MSGLEKLRVKNFQSHKDTVVTFSPRITAIVGTSDSGKTALVRSLKWVAFNRPLGKSIIRKNSKGGCDVEILREGVCVRKTRDSGGTSYYVGKEPFEKVGANVPHQVQDTLNLGEINFQSQLEPHFLVLKSGGQIANYISSVLKLDILDTAVSISSRQIKEAERKRTELTATISDLEGKLDAYDTLEEIEVKVEKYQKADAEAVDLDGQISDLHTTIQQLEKLETEMEEYEQLEEMDSLVTELERLLGEAVECASSLFSLSSAVEKTEALEKPLQTAERNVSLYEGQLEEYQENYEKALRNMGNCPWCGQVMSEKVIKWKRAKVA